MNAKKLLLAAQSGILGFALAAGATGCLITSFDLPLAHRELLWALWLAAGLLAPLFRGKLRFLMPLLTALPALWLWREAELADQLLHLLARLATVYDRAYGWGVPQMLLSAQAESFDLPLGLMGLLITLAAAHAAGTGGSLMPGFVLALIPMGACVVVTDTLPEPKYLLTALWAGSVLLLGVFVSPEDRARSLGLTARAGLVTAAALLLLATALPPEGYRDRTEAIRQTIRSAAWDMPRVLEAQLHAAASRLLGTEPRQVDLAALGERLELDFPVMEITADFDGRLYLRSRDYDRYDGLGWESEAGRSELYPAPGNPRGTVTLVTRGDRSSCYLPCYPAADTTLSGGSAPNPGRLRQYTLSVSALPENWRELTLERKENPRELGRYLALPEQTRQEALELTRELWREDYSHTEIADAISAFVSTAARYDKKAPVMPAEEKDFALWFLRSVDRGYCVHFATAATVLLRSAGVPARYVTGYTAQVRAGQTVTVTEESAHAWAEYFDPALGCWVILEATPGRMELPARAEPATEPPPETVPPAESLPATVPQTRPEATEPVHMPTAPGQIQVPPEEAPAALPAIPPALPAAIAAISALAASVWLQRKLRLRLRRCRLDRAAPNEKALLLWAEAERLGRLTGQQPPRELLQLAQKAKFSSHTLTDLELVRLERHNALCIARLQGESRRKQWLSKYIHAVW